MVYGPLATRIAWQCGNKKSRGLAPSLPGASLRGWSEAQLPVSFTFLFEPQCPPPWGTTTPAGR